MYSTLGLPQIMDGLSTFRSVFDSLLFLSSLSSLLLSLTKGPAVKFSETTTVPPSAPPILGQHTQEVLQGLLGMDSDDISALRQEKVI